MALIFCPHCGKRISDRVETCPHCNTALEQTSGKPVGVKECCPLNVKKHLLAVAAATVEAFVLTNVLSIVLGLCSSPLGAYATRAFRVGSSAFRPQMVLISVGGLAVLCGLPLILQRIIPVKAQVVVAVLSAALAALWGNAYFSYDAAQRILAAAADTQGVPLVGAEVIGLARFVPFFNAVVLPLYQGGFYFLYRPENRKKTYRMQLIFAGLALVLTAVFGFVSIVVLHLGTQGAAFAGALAAILLFLSAAIAVNR